MIERIKHPKMRPDYTMHGSGKARLIRARIATVRLDGATLLLNFIVQRVFRVNADSPWSVHYTSRVICPTRISLGRGVPRSLAVSGGIYIQAINGVSIGADTVIAPGAKIISANHSRGNGGHVDAKPVAIGSGCWIGANVIVLPGVTIGDGAVVGAGSIVSRDIPPNVVAVGAPAVPIRRDGP